MERSARARSVAQGGGLRTFGTRPLGRVILVAVAIVAVGFAIVFLGDLIGIGTFLLLGLAVPIYAGVKRPRTLAILGLAILLLAAPLASVLVTQQTFAPSPSVSSFNVDGGPVLQNATVDPFSAGDGAAFYFHADLLPTYLYHNSTLHNITLFVTTCPYVTAPNESTTYCGSYSSYHQVLPLNVTYADPRSTITFQQKLAGPNIYWWTMYGTYTFDSNCTKNCTQYVFLNSGNSYADVQGPVTGDFFSVLGIVIVPVYVLFIYPAIAFYAALLFYMWFKGREARRRAATGMGPAPSGPGPVAGTGTGTAGAGGAGAVPEQHCPNCQAVVYPNEAQCWKCGAALNVSAAPLVSEKGPSNP